MQHEDLRKFTLAGMFAAMGFVCFSYLRIELPMVMGLTGKLYIGYAFTVLAALLLGPRLGGLSGAIGLTLADILSYSAAAAPPTFLSKFIQGYAVGFIAHNLMHLSEVVDPKKTGRIVLVAALGGAVVNLLTEPVIRYAFKFYILGIPQTMAFASVLNTAISMSINNGVSTFIACLLYKAVPKNMVR